MEQLTIEQVDQQIEEIESRQSVNQSGEGDVPVIEKICGIVTLATPILKFVRAILFFKHKWQLIIDQVLAVATMACGTEDSKGL